jgi:small subunit ribosomal protein S16
MQRTGRKGHAMFRVVVQDSRRTPTSGKVVASLGSYDPHSKKIILNKEKAAFYVDHGAQPSERVAVLLKAEGVKLPKWVALPAKKERAVRNAEKRRSTRPEEPEAPAEEPAPAEEAPVETPAEETPAEETAEPEVEEKPAEEAEA